MSKFSASLQTGEIRFPNGTIVRLPQEGIATQWTPESGRLRSASLPAEEDTSPQFRSALAELGFREQETIHLDVPPPPANARLRSDFPAKDIVRIQPAAPPPNTAQVILYQDESGGMSWHFPHGSQPAAGATVRGLRSPDLFVIPARTAHAVTALPNPHGGARLRGPITKWGRKIFKVLLVPLEPLAAPAVTSIVRKAEEKHRQDLIRSVTLANSNQLVREPFTDWSALDRKRSLLIVHGIFSTTHGTLASFPARVIEELSAHYQGRVIGFDHLTVSRSPEDNARYFLETLKRESPAGQFTFDVLCHSRGGIVSRTLAERGKELAPDNNCTFRKVFFVAVPNNGSVLGDPGHVVDMLDTFTNLLTWFPDGSILYSIEVLLAIVKLIAHTAERRLPGLAAMGTDGYIQHVLNKSQTAAPAHYMAAASDYAADPKAGNSLLTGALGDRLLDRVFTLEGRRVANDLVVPCEGVFARNGHPSFPIANPLIFRGAEGVWHCNFFQQARTLKKIKEHFELEPLSVELPSPQPRPRFRGHRAVPRMDVDLDALTAEAPKDLTREPHIDFRDLVHEGEPNELTVRLEEALGGGSLNVLSVGLAPGQTSVTLQVTLNAPGFDIASGGCSTITLERVRNPDLEKTSFVLVARNPGPNPVRREIRADFWSNGSPIGAVRHVTFVIPKNYTGSLQGQGSSRRFDLVLSAEGREGCDFTLFIEGQDEPGRPPYCVRMSSQIPGREYAARRAGKFNLDGGTSAAEYFQQIYRKQLANFPADTLSDAAFAAALPQWEEDFNRELDALGRKLWQILPQPFRDEYFELYAAGTLPRSILIHSDETVVPWELAVPHSMVGGKLVVLEPLGTAHILGRWQPGLRIKPHPQRMEVRNFCVVRPSYGGQGALAGASEEIGTLRKLLPRIHCVSPATRNVIHREVLDRGDVQVFHFSGHGSYDPQNTDLNALLLEDGDLNATLVTGSRLAAEAQPIVFLNACSVGSSGFVIGRIGGFVANFLESGASGVIAPYWPVLDSHAFKFSLSVYEKLKLGRAVGEALQELRQDYPRDPSIRAFAYFGDPWARLNLSPLS
jgi:CHAT domain